MTLPRRLALVLAFAATPLTHVFAIETAPRHESFSTEPATRLAGNPVGVDVELRSVRQQTVEVRVPRTQTTIEATLPTRQPVALRFETK